MWYKTTRDNGTQVYAGGTYSNITDYKERTFASGTLEIAHNADGTKSFTVGAFSGQVYKDGSYLTASAAAQSFDLPTIPRASSVSTSGSTLGAAVAITINRASSSFTHKLYYSCGSLQKQSIASDVGTSYSWTPPVSLAQQAPNAATVAATLTVETYNGSTYIGTTTVQMALSVPSNVVPTLSVDISDPTGNSTIYGGYVQLRSKVQVKITASGAQGSTIKAYSIKVGAFYAATTATGTTDFLPSSGTLSVLCTATDSRGRTASSTQSITVLAYARPTISAISAARCNQDGTDNRSGQYGKVVFSGAITSLSSKNTAAYTAQYREYGGETWTNAGSAAAGNFAPADVAVVFAADKNKRYEVRVLATDAFEGIGSSIRDLPAAYSIQHLAKSMLSVGIGRLCDKKNALQVGLKAYFDEDVEIDGGLTVGGKSIFDLIYPVGSVYIAYNHTDPSTLFGGTWERIEDAFLWACGAEGTIGVTGGEQTHTLTVDEMPAHTHGTRAQHSDGTEAWGFKWGTDIKGKDSTSDTPHSGISPAGGGQPHNNMPPYIQVSVWRRTA